MIESYNAYFKNLLNHLNKTNNLFPNEKNDYWIELYLNLNSSIKEANIIFLPDLMPLIYPDFLYNSEGYFIGGLIEYNSLNFNSGINLSEDCQFSTIQENGYCEFNNYRNIRGKCQADHFWPHSLGGPTIIENRVLLCKFHNVAKSNSILNKFWNSYPIWLNGYLKRMYNLKS